MTSPPTTPQETKLQRVLAISRLNGRGVAWLCAASVVFMVLQGALKEAGLAAVATTAGLLELHGRRRLLAGAAGGVAWLVLAQLWLLALIVGYAVWRWSHFNPDEMWGQLPSFFQGYINNRMLLAGLDPVYDRPLLLELTNRATCVSFVLVALIYQGGLAVYYTFQQSAVREALSAPPVAPPHSPLA